MNADSFGLAWINLARIGANCSRAESVLPQVGRQQFDRHYRGKPSKIPFAYLAFRVSWATPRNLHAVRALQNAELPVSALVPDSDSFNDKLRRTQAMIEETRDLMNRTLGDCIDPNCAPASRPRKRARVKA